ncbi:hypothetical protein ABZ470_23815 [Streptosporangium sp. NPDC020072]|uniref:toprim domain-containing protein n=1 Tax=Streptosporangium sp. NPDC020072 TaxID=3154788 RepID=UPI00342B9056
MRRLDKEQLSSLEETCRDYEIALSVNPEALSYLHGRGLSLPTIDRFRLGLVESPSPSHRTVAGWLSMPTLKGVGVTGFKFRCIKPECVSGEVEKHDGHPKYLTYDPQALGNVADLDTDLGFIVVCEGELDAYILSGECGIPAIPMPGASAWKGHRHWRRLLKDFRTIYVIPDDDAHLKANVGRKMAEEIRADLPQATIVELPSLTEGKKTDVNDIFIARGRDYLRSLVGLEAA